MNYREAQLGDIKQIQFVRNAVKENTLSNPALVPDEDVAEYITKRGKGWVCVVHSEVAGFAIVDLIDNNIWALFVHPDFEGDGIGKKLHDIMLAWYFEKTKEKVWLRYFAKYKGRKILQDAGMEGSRGTWQRGNKI